MSFKTHNLSLSHSVFMSYCFSCSCSCFSLFSYFISYSCFMNTAIHIAFSCYYYIWNFIYLYSMMPMYSHIIHVFLSLYESILLRNLNHSNWIIQTKVMAFSCQTSQFSNITLGTVCNTHFSRVLTPYLTLVLYIHLNLRC